MRGMASNEGRAGSGDDRALDLLITGGIVVDGTGAPRYEAAVGVTRRWAGASATVVLYRDAAAIEDAIGRSQRLLDARGKVVAPGFIDLHSHSGLVLLANPLHEAKVAQGVTSEVIGVDGLSYAPIRLAAHMRELVEMNAGLDGAPGDRVRLGVGRATTWSGSTPGSASTSRSSSATPRSGSRRRAGPTSSRARPTSSEMRSMLREAMEEGAYGISSGLDYPPGSYASTGELANLASEAARLHGIYHTHVRYTLGDRFLDPFREAIEIGRRGDAPAHITHFYHRATFPGTPEQMLQLVDDARAEGLDVTFDAYPYEWASTRLLITIPTWVQEGGPAATRERLADREVRGRIRGELEARGVLYAGAGRHRRHPARGVPEPGEPPLRGPHARRHLRRGGLRSRRSTVRPAARGGPAPQPGDARTAHGRHPALLPAPGGDGRHGLDVRRPRSRRRGRTGPTRGSWASSCATRRVLGLEEAVAKMTSMPADRLGLKARGRIVDDAIADLVVFDPATVRSNATYDEPRRRPDGIEHVLVNGRFVLEDGQHTGATPGRALRRGRD